MNLALSFKEFHPFETFIVSRQLPLNRKYALIGGMSISLAPRQRSAILFFVWLVVQQHIPVAERLGLS